MEKVDLKKFSEEELSAASGRMTSPGVPPKSRAEAELHLKQIEKLKEHERKLMGKEAVERRLVREDCEKCLAHWNDVVVKGLDAQLFLPSTDAIWKRRGVPQEYRGVVWEKAFGNPRGITMELFNMCSRKSKERPHGKTEKIEAAQLAKELDPAFFSPEASKSITAQQIAVDLPRTIIARGTHGAVSPRSPNSPRSSSPISDVTSPLEISETTQAMLVGQMGRDDALLRRISSLLRAFVEFRPDLGYVQGMSYLAAMLLMHMDDFASFTCLATLMTMGHFPYFYSVNTSGMSAHMSVFEDVLTDGVPEVANHFKVIGVNCQMYVIDWWMSLFSRTLPYEIAARCWDLFINDNAYLYRISFAILKYFEYIVHEEAGFDEVLSFLTKIQQHPMEEEKFFALVNDFSVGPDLQKIHSFMATRLSHLKPIDDDL